MYSSYTSFFKEVAARLTLLGDTPGKANLMFIDSPEIADNLLSSLSAKVCYPLLLVEWYDEETAYNGSGYHRELTGSFAVVAPQERMTKGHEQSLKVIYDTTKPAADAIFSLMRQRADVGLLLHNGQPISLGTVAPGNWVGPLHNDLYGWRIEFTWKLPGTTCFNPDLWRPESNEV